MQTYAYGYPRLGEGREFKRLIEGYWQGKVSESALRDGIAALERQRLATYAQFVDAFPVGEMTLYDAMLDTAIMLGVYPIDPNDLNAYFELARGENALPMTKWFNTNYHYLVPHLSRATAFRLHWNKPLQHVREWRATSGSPQIAHLMGPYTFVRLSRGYTPDELPYLLEAVAEPYGALLRELHQADVAYVQIDEPALVLDVPAEHFPALQRVYQSLGQEIPLLLMTYYDSVEVLPLLYELPLAGIGLDLVHGKRNWHHIGRFGFPSDKILVAGIIDGRNVWRSDLSALRAQVENLQSRTGAILWLSNGSPLMHLPVSVSPEDKLDPALKARIAFAKERLQELQQLKRLLLGESDLSDRSDLPPTDHWYSAEVQQRVANLRPSDFEREMPYSERDPLQRARLNLPLFPTTTIGSFPQTPEVRQMRTAYRNGKITAAEYEAFIQNEIRRCIELQESLGLDVLVHGEFERTDMVEFFAEKMAGIAFTQQGWLLSYGTRVYRPPIIYGDVQRREPMTLKEITFAQSLTQKPVKGMLTGPVTIVAWSFVREDIPVEQVAFQIALALQDEVRDLEAAGIAIIQIDEPAYRERAPLKRADWEPYFRWAAQAFKLAARARPETQIHTHMCYSEFNEVLPFIDWMDADVITIEATRSKGEVISAFERYHYTRQIGPGVFDVHSPVVPRVEAIEAIIERAIRVIPRERFWINPDCGLKTRRWEEVIPALQHMVQAARNLRARYG
jgi:5-methyltetrahydropteroyltriglutamate--homocysteine methyltransferase